MAEIINFPIKNVESISKKMDKIEKTFVVKAENSNVYIEDGYSFLAALKKEAKRQKAITHKESMIKESMNIVGLPISEAVSEEIALADTFEIIEEN